MFQKVDSKIIFPQLEESILRFWEEHMIFPGVLRQAKGHPTTYFMRVRLQLMEVLEFIMYCLGYLRMLSVATGR